MSKWHNKIFHTEVVPAKNKKEQSEKVYLSNYHEILFRYLVNDSKMIWNVITVGLESYAGFNEKGFQRIPSYFT